MTTLREAAQQALEALGLWATGRDMDAVALNDLIFRLEAALAEPVLQALADADRIMGHDDESTEWRERWAHLFSCALTNGGYQCSCGASQKVHRPAPPQRPAEPVQEPVALDWLHKWANQDDGEPETQWHEGYEAARRVVQIHLTAPPQRKPLTEIGDSNG